LANPGSRHGAGPVLCARACRARLCWAPRSLRRVAGAPVVLTGPDVQCAAFSAMAPRVVQRGRKSTPRGPSPISYRSVMLAQSPTPPATESLPHAHAVTCDALRVVAVAMSSELRLLSAWYHWPRSSGTVQLPTRGGPCPLLRRLDQRRSAGPASCVRLIHAHWHYRRPANRPSLGPREESVFLPSESPSQLAQPHPTKTKR
jgi:hypothetical protein